MKQYNVYNEHGAYLGSVEADDNISAIIKARRERPLEPIEIQEIKRYGDLVDKNRRLSSHLRNMLNEQLSEFYRDTGVKINEIEIEFEPPVQDQDDANYIADVKLHLNL